ncbi:ARM repeat-containing protein [Trichodelitschia bisporula]|uniref:ARM repeat-containing protein n=1 Tax=Trichodelitschia bisporula TaxID=703511 RepID=A0A6G1HMG3_9PEZI|nr:ARM repeat-containing protein [Trichodelitschia bisporula]
MAFSNGLRSPREETAFPTYSSSIRPIGNQTATSNASSTHPERQSLHRRFTTNTVPTLPSLSTLTPLSPIGQQRRYVAEPSDLASSLERTKQEYLKLRQQRERFQTELETLDRIDLQKKEEMERLENEVHGYNVAGHLSEPTTPPEYRDNGFTPAFSRPHRLSLASIASPQSLSSMVSPRAARSGSVGFSSYASHATPHQSVPGSRRGSDEEDSYDSEIITLNNRTTGTLRHNRNSVPANFDFRGLADSSDTSDVHSILGIKNIQSLLNEDDDKLMPSHYRTTSIDGKGRLHMSENSEKFPILVRRDFESVVPTTTASSGLDRAGVLATDGDHPTNGGWPSFARHRAGQQSLPMNTLRPSTHTDDFDLGSTVPSARKLTNNRRSMDVQFSVPSFGESKRSSLHAISQNGTSNGIPKPTLQSSLSTNDIPTVKNSNGLNAATSAALSQSTLTHAEQHLQNHNVNIGRIPPSAVNRHSRKLSASDLRLDESKPFNSLAATLQSSTAPFGSNTSVPAVATATTIPPTSPHATSGASNPFVASMTAVTAGVSAPMSPQTMNAYAAQAYYGGYGVPMINMAMSNLNLGSPQWANQMPMYGGGYPGYGPGFPQFPVASRFPAADNQTRVMQQRRLQTAEDTARFANFKLENLNGRVYELCKDQYGCRFLQRKLEEQDPEHVRMIFEETKSHVVDLMTDPFGNYLCQKLLEFSNDHQRTVLINNAAPSMVKIALNQHGTRALQKMIEFISTQDQIQTVIRAFEGEVVTLIQDLNGNHVIQKCLNHLKPQDAQFIFDAVGIHCLTVGTHRHGCCVLQRCIDHATGNQKTQLVAHITSNALALVQDPFGNYVVQYILDLNIPDFTRPLCLSFLTKLIELSKQKFSSNVIEKCLRVSDVVTKRRMIEELLIAPTEMEKILKDLYANYVIQTALEYGDPEIKARLWDIVIPILPNIRGTPCGRRLSQKLQAAGASRNEFEPTLSPQEASHQPVGPIPGFTQQASMSYPQTPAIASPQPHRLSNGTLPAHLQNTVNQQFVPYSRGVPFF